MRILVVDDEPIVLRVIVAALEADGHDVITAENATKALDICKESVAVIDLVISDVMMPGLSGRELAKCIEMSSKPIPVVLMSGYTNESPSVVSMVHDGKLDNCLFLQKPFTIFQLRTTVAQYAA